MSLLEAIFLVQRLPAWTPGIGNREDDQITGKALENFVAMELVRHADSSNENPKAYHYRRGRDEIDVILENRAGDICAMEVKASATVRDKDWGPLARLRDARSKSFRCGVLFYTGAQTLPLGDRLYAVPLSGLWTQ